MTLVWILCGALGPTLTSTCCVWIRVCLSHALKEWWIAHAEGEALARATESGSEDTTRLILASPSLVFLVSYRHISLCLMHGTSRQRISRTRYNNSFAAIPQQACS